MTTTKMLIDAAHPEETRVVVLRGNRVEEFDFESANRRPLRGNIYLAKVTRVEPSLQAAFVDFGGNRHGFLAFSEIHPDYYQIPTADRLALLAEEAEAARNEEDEEERGRGRRSRANTPRPKRSRRNEESVSGDLSAVDAASDENADTTGSTPDAHGDQDPEVTSADENDASHAGDAASGDANGEDAVEQLGGGGDAMEEVPMRAPHRSRKQYKIQEVIKRRQILLVQVVKEERGSKGAALTTYLSLAGRYSVLMPNTARGGGISRKITNTVDRKRLKSMASELEVPDGMGVILRTAGASRTKSEIKRDFEYLMRMWESVRALTLESTAPTLVYEEGSLIKRAIRDLYSKDIEDIQVAGEDGYREAKDFMRMLMPSHAKVVQPYRDSSPLFTRFGVETQLDAMFSNIVTLKSGGYIVMNQTEALVAVDVNSGRSTREHNIEDTALKTNIEAAEEVARQLRLRDLAGLVVIDFIDMEENRNNKAVERKLNECLKNDRARIQVGRISHFGLLEMSRQRIRTGVLESSTTPCPHCAGTGLLRSTPSLALHVLRALEETLLKNATHDITVRTRVETAFYILNQKRESLRALEERFGVSISIVADAHLTPGQNFVVERGEPVTPRLSAEKVEGEASSASAPRHGASRAITTADIDMDDAVDDVVDEDEASEGPEAGEPREARSETGEERPRSRRRRRRGRGRGGEGRNGEGRPDGAGGETQTGTDEPRAQHNRQPAAINEDDDDGEDSVEAAGEPNADGVSAEEKRRRRRRRGGRRNRRDRDAPRLDGEGNEIAAEASAAAPLPPQTVVAAAGDTVFVDDSAPKKPRSTRARKKDAEDAAPAPAPAPEAIDAAAKPARAARARKPKAEAQAEIAPEVKAQAAAKARPPAKAAVANEPPAPKPAQTPAATPPEPEPDDPNRPKRGGWWNRAKEALGG